MEFTTHLELHSQATRLDGSRPDRLSAQRDGIITLSDPPFKGELTLRDKRGLTPVDYNSACADFQIELFPLHSPLLWES
jgi:hypothetical protein